MVKRTTSSPRRTIHAHLMVGVAADADVDLEKVAVAIAVGFSLTKVGEPPDGGAREGLTQPF